MINEYLKSIKFNYIKAKHYKNYKVNRSLTNYQNELDTLIKNGILILPEFFDKDIVDQIVNEIKPTMFDLCNNKYSGKNKSFRFDDYGVYRLLDIDKISPTSKKFFELDLINELAKAYVSKNVHSYQKMSELKPLVGNMSVSDNWHFDDWKHRYKAFLYLADVGEEQAPFVYLKGSHNENMEWRKRKELEYYIYGRHKGSYGYFVPDEVNYIIEKYNLEKIVCTAKAGSLIIADTRGLHKGNVLRKDYRLTLASYFDIR